MNRKTIHITPDDQDIRNVFNDKNTKVTDDHLAESCRDDLRLFKTALWGIWLMAEYDRTDGPHPEELDNIVTRFFDLNAKIEKALEFAELAQYATGFDIPEDITFNHFDLIDLGELTLNGDTNE